LANASAISSTWTVARYRFSRSHRDLEYGHADLYLEDYWRLLGAFEAIKKEEP
jgi:hypothetical protein